MFEILLQDVVDIDTCNPQELTHVIPAQHADIKGCFCQRQQVVAIPGGYPGWNPVMQAANDARKACHKAPVLQKSFLITARDHGALQRVAGDVKVVAVFRQCHRFHIQL